MNQKTQDIVNINDKAALKELVTDVLKSAQQKGATAAEVGLNLNSGLSAKVRLGEVETIEFNRDKSLGVTVYFDKKKGNASTSDLNRNAIKETVQAACDIAKHTESDPCAGLADANLMATEFPDLNLHHPYNLNSEQAIELAKACEQFARDADARIVNSDGAGVDTYDRYHLYANTHGFIGAYPTTRYSLSCVVIGKEDDKMQRDYDYTVSRNFEEMTDYKTIGKNAAKRTVARLGAKKIATCQTPVIFAAEIASSLLGHFISAISGGNLYRKASFLLDHLNEKIYPEWVNIFEQPLMPKGLGSTAFDSEGIATKNQAFIENGILKNYALSSYSARKLKMQPTGNAGGVHNLQIQSGNQNLKQLMQQMDKGLLITELMGHGTNIVTGDYSRGAAGFWVENGEIQYPVEEITVAGNLKNMFQGLQAVGNDVDMRSNLLTGSWLIEQMTVAGE